MDFLNILNVLYFIKAKKWLGTCNYYLSHTALGDYELIPPDKEQYWVCHHNLFIPPP